MAKPKVWIITTGGGRPLRDVAKDLAAAGLVGAKILEAIGCITGSAEDKVVPRLRKVRGVTDVFPSSPVDVGPPDSPETW
jgi:hypothetical protein